MEKIHCVKCERKFTKAEQKLCNEYYSLRGKLLGDTPCSFDAELKLLAENKELRELDKAMNEARKQYEERPKTMVVKIAGVETKGTYGGIQNIKVNINVKCEVCGVEVDWITDRNAWTPPYEDLA